MPNALSRWLEKTNTSQAVFASRIGRTQPHVSRLMRDLTAPDLDDLFAIERETGGAVPASAWKHLLTQRPQLGSGKSVKRGGVVRRAPGRLPRQPSHRS